MTQRAGVFGRQSAAKQKSITQQVEICTADALAEGMTVAQTWREGRSASRHGKAAREVWPTVVQAVRNREIDVLVLWRSDRGDRTLTSWSALLDDCRAAGVLIRCTDDQRTYDVRRAADWETLASQGVANAAFSDKLSAAVLRDAPKRAAEGRPPAGRAPFGYRRTFDPGTGQLDGQEIDPATAPTVREIIERVAKGDPISVITDDLNARGVPTSGAARWYRVRVRQIAANVAYAGLRRHRERTYPASWPAIVDAETFWAAQAVLGDPSRLTARPGRQRHLLTFLATCGAAGCGGWLRAHKGRYECQDGTCVTIDQAATDGYVRDVILGVVSRPETYARLRHLGEVADAEAVAASAEVKRLEAELADWRKSAWDGRGTTPESLASIEQGLTKRIETAQRRADAASLPPALRTLLEPGADVRARWEDMPVPARRDAIRALATVTVNRATPGVRYFDPARVRVEPV